MQARMIEKPISSSNVKLKIVLVEDNDINRLLMRDFLIHCGHYVIDLANATNFLETLEEINPDVILLDLKLKDMDGFQLLEQIQISPKFQQIPIIVISGLAFEADKKRALALGVHKYLVKPINLNDLRQVLQEEVDCSWRC
ncbi:response regulator [Leptodesmis sichuanensis]|uniref:response regulator n=1 Tax=Leptodesmis sichuanensis TaxID=2906798 RepID=UPI001F24E7ED|nr:response regulator [Leptodesmis sichuanensis]MCA1994396.1 response regulator [Coleofasciculus sp. S288]